MQASNAYTGDLEAPHARQGVSQHAACQMAKVLQQHVHSIVSCHAHSACAVPVLRLRCACAGVLQAELAAREVHDQSMAA